MGKTFFQQKAHKQGICAYHHGHAIGLVPCKLNMVDCTGVCMVEQIIFGQYSVMPVSDSRDRLELYKDYIVKRT